MFSFVFLHAQDRGRWLTNLSVDHSLLQSAFWKAHVLNGTEILHKVDWMFQTTMVQAKLKQKATRKQNSGNLFSELGWPS